MRRGPLRVSATSGYSSDPAYRRCRSRRMAPALVAADCPLHGIRDRWV